MAPDNKNRPDIDAAKANKIKDFINLARGDNNKVDNIEQIPDYVVQKASLISAHFLLPSNAKVVDIGCGNGQVTYALALLNPLRNFIGIDNDRHSIEKAKQTYKLPNLSFEYSDARLPEFEDSSIDGIINSNILHEVYSAHARDPDVLSEMLDAQIRKLKPGGTMLIRDYMMPPNDEYVLLELPDNPSIGKSPQDLSYADLLIEYSQTARPMEDGGYEGFYLEEFDPAILTTLNPTLEKVGAYEMTDEDKARLGEDFTFDEDNSRVFRLLHKWAVEFIHRKDERRKWEQNLDREFTFFTERDYRRELTKYGMRFVFSAPYCNPWVMDHFYKGKFRLYTEDAHLKPPPATNYFIVAQKLVEKQSLTLDERRPSTEATENLEIITVRDQKDGSLHEIARRPGEFCDVIPWRVTADNRLVIYVLSGFPRPIINAVKRGNANLDNKNWSGHLIEPIIMDTLSFTSNSEDNQDQIIEFIKQNMQLDVKSKQKMYVGTGYYPSPDTIDEMIEPVFMEVKKPAQTMWDVLGGELEGGFKFGGKIVELDANDIIRAAQVGLLPEPRLELHVFDLMDTLGIEPPSWVTGKITVDMFREFDENDVPDMLKHENILNIEQLLDEWEQSGFQNEKLGGDHLKSRRSVFVEEGKFGGAMRGMASQDYEFLVTEDGVENIAVVSPLTRGWDDQLMIGVEVKNLPVPQRVGGSGAMITAPSFVIPRDVQTIEDAKKFVADKFGVTSDRVWQLGESYFLHTGVTPQRVYPFVVADAGKPDNMSWQYTNMKKIKSLIYGFRVCSTELAKDFVRIHMMMGDDHTLGGDRSFENSRHKPFTLNTDKLQVQRPGDRHAPLSRVLGERDSRDAVPNKRSYDQKITRPLNKMPKEGGVSLEKTPEDKLTLDLKNETQHKKPEVSIKASEDLKKAMQGLKKEIPKRKKPSGPEMK